MIRLITAATRECLEPLGLRRGKSRSWYDDRDWWIINVEFQASRRPGTYLNIGAMWLWTDQEHWSFDEGCRVHWQGDGSFASTTPLGERGWTNFLDFRTADQFSHDVRSLAQIAARRVAELRAQFPDPPSVVRQLASRRTRSDESPWWHAYHTGAAAAFCGDAATARRSFDRITPNNLGVEWEHDLARRASELSSLANDPDALRQRLHTTVQATRQRLKLSPGPTAAPGS
ncbi:hypothetical protein ACLQ28_33730 [Micromonospora sp. DT201]|uniref:hypothetical protein n=1 Tax=Micromonospora sp. DT201 TaxID=3393442 RepID=UPI003CEA2D91